MPADQKQFVPGGTIWSEIMCFSRVVKVCNLVEVGGTISIDDNGDVVGAGDAYQQTKYIFQKIEQAMGKVGAKLTDVIRTRLYVTDIRNQRKDVRRAHSEVFGDHIKPVISIIEVKQLISPAFLVEIEATAVM